LPNNERKQGILSYKININYCIKLPLMQVLSSTDSPGGVTGHGKITKQGVK